MSELSTDILLRATLSPVAGAAVVAEIYPAFAAFSAALEYALKVCPDVAATAEKRLKPSQPSLLSGWITKRGLEPLRLLVWGDRASRGEEDTALKGIPSSIMNTLGTAAVHQYISRGGGQS